MTYTVAMLPVSKRTYDEIESSLRAAGYEHAISPLTIDMNGIALVAEDEDDSVQAQDQADGSPDANIQSDPTRPS